MQDIKDCNGHLACRGNPETGLVEALYKGQLTSTVLSPGEVFTIERQGVITKIQLSSKSTFIIRSFKKAS